MMKRNKYKILSIILGISLSLSGCNLTNDKRADKVIPIVKEDGIDNIEDMAIASNCFMPITENQEVVSEVVYDELSESYIDYFDSLDFSYKNGDFYPTMETLSALKDENKKLVKCDYEFPGYSEIIDQIISNTERFVKEHPEYKNPFAREPYYFRSAISSAIKNINTYANNDTNADFHQISELSVVLGTLDVETSRLYTAIYDHKNNVIVINYDYIKSLVEENNYPYQKFLYYTISHEMNHVRENVCPCNSSYEYYNMNYIPGEYSFILESCAESDLYNTMDLENILAQFSYDDERKYEGEILLINLTNGNLDKDYYNAIFDVDYSLLFRALNLNNSSSQLELLHILTNIDGLCYRNNLIKSIYGDKEYITLNEVFNGVGIDYKENIMKLALSNLVKYTATHDDFSLQENLVLLSIIKSYLIDTTYTYEEKGYDIYKVYNRDVIDNLALMESVYVEYLSKKYQVSIEEIRAFENDEIEILVEAMKDMVENPDVNYGVVSRICNEIMNKFPGIKVVLASDPNLSYKMYENRVNATTLKLSD